MFSKLAGSWKRSLPTVEATAASAHPLMLVSRSSSPASVDRASSHSSPEACATCEPGCRAGVLIADAHWLHILQRSLQARCSLQANRLPVLTLTHLCARMQEFMLLLLMRPDLIALNSVPSGP